MAGKHSARPTGRWPRRILITANVLVALAIIGTASAYGYVEYRLGQIKRVTIPGLVKPGLSVPKSQSKPVKGSSALPPFTTLIIGSDSRNLGAGSNAAFGNSTEDPGQRSDSIILVRVVPATHSIALFSIPRDTLVPIPGYGTTRINAAFNAGNAGLLVEVLSQDFGIQVNHVAELDFTTFEDIANAIGGVYQWFPGPAKDAFSDLEISQGGCVLLTGATALAFARSREYEYSTDGGKAYYYQQFPESDLGRIQRQQDIIKLAAKKAQKIAPTNPLALNRLVTSLTKDITLDSGFSNSLLLDLVREFRDSNLSDIPSYTYPTNNSTTVSGALTPDTALGTQTVKQWLAIGQTPPAAATTKSGTASSTTVATTVPASTTSSTPPTTAISPASVTVEVVNGSGTAGQALLASGQLQALDYRTTVGGDSAFNHAKTVIDYAPDSRADAVQLKTELTGGAVLTEEPSLAAGPYNLELITGQDYGGTTKSPSTTVPSTTSAPTTTTTLAPETNANIVGSATVQPDSSSFYKGRYIPPGREPGQIPGSCPT